jgi:predicted nucleic acid-binding protein
LIFVDSSFFIAIADKKDQWHEKARKITNDLKKDLLITNLVLVESVTAIGARGGGKAGTALYDYLSDNCKIIYVLKDDIDMGMKIFLKYDGTLSVADSISIVVMESKGIDQILSFDRDFDKVEGLKRIS